jgi:hypothetical protein
MRGGPTPAAVRRARSIDNYEKGERRRRLNTEDQTTRPRPCPRRRAGGRSRRPRRRHRRPALRERRRREYEHMSAGRGRDPVLGPIPGRGGQRLRAWQADVPLRLGRPTTGAGTRRGRDVERHSDTVRDLPVLCRDARAPGRPGHLRREEDAEAVHPQDLQRARNRLLARSAPRRRSRRLGSDGSLVVRRRRQAGVDGVGGRTAWRPDASPRRSNRRRSRGFREIPLQGDGKGQPRPLGKAPARDLRCAAPAPSHASGPDGKSRWRLSGEAESRRRRCPDALEGQARPSAARSSSRPRTGHAGWHTDDARHASHHRQCARQTRRESRGRSHDCRTRLIPSGVMRALQLGPYRLARARLTFFRRSRLVLDEPPVLKVESTRARDADTGRDRSRGFLRALARRLARAKASTHIGNGHALLRA